MLDEMQVNDEQLDASDIRQLESADEMAHFFARLRYDVDKRTNIPDYAMLGMGSEDMRQHIHKIELIGKDPEDGDISIYLFEVRSVTAKLRNDIARRFRERPENTILVLTKDYEVLEFVMLERVLSRSQSRWAALKQAIRPIPLAVNRLYPDPIALRVLKRFTFTEEDAAYQWEKLRSAYMLAQWSEAYFNNRALFSDYYLQERLTDPKITPMWDEDVRPVGREIYKHLVTARKDYTRQTVDVICKGLYEPVFKMLGFDFAKQKTGASSAGKADYLLYTPGDKSKPIAAVLTYVWNRNLDDVDESRECAEDDGGTPFRIPGAMVVSLLEAQVAPWVIVTNGKLWRLYSSTASNKATNYYEIDLEEAIAANDQITALQYWRMMFRQQAFTGFLDNLLKNSADYAKELGERLKDRVFEDIFPQFAGENLAEPRSLEIFCGDRLLLQRIIQKEPSRLVGTLITENDILCNTDVFTILDSKLDNKYSARYLLAVLLSSLIGQWLFTTNQNLKRAAFPKINTNNLFDIPIFQIHFTTPVHERGRLAREAIGAYDLGDNAGVLQRVQTHINADKTDVVHDLLAHLAQQMIDLNQQKQVEVKRFFTWVEEYLKIQPDKSGADGIDSLTGKTILQGYLGDYQKGEGELPWREFHYRLYQNRNRFALSLSEVEGESQRKYEKSLETLLPIKRDLARTDALIDKIVYRLYGLTDEEIELIERPQYEQALADAKAQVIADDKIKDDEEKIEKIAAGYLPAAQRFFERVEPASVEAMLDSELPHWRSLPPDAPTFLLTGDYNLHTLPEHMDFSSSVIPYTKAVETVLYERIFAPFRDGSGYAEVDCNNEFLKDFMRGKKKLTLGNFMIILRSSRETALQTFISRTYPDVAQRVFGTKGLVATLSDEGMLDIRNKAAHDEVLSRDEAQQTRA